MASIPSFFLYLFLGGLEFGEWIGEQNKNTYFFRYEQIGQIRT